MMISALLTFPRAVSTDAETRSALAMDRSDEEPVGIVIRPGPASARPRLSLRAALAAARA